MIRTYQIEITDAMHNDINKLGHSGAEQKYPEYGAYLNLSFQGSENFKPEMFKFFKETFRVATDSLDRAFDLTNLWNNKDAVEVVRRGHSTSVGDILEKDGVYYMVDNFGFKQIAV